MVLLFFGLGSGQGEPGLRGHRRGDSRRIPWRIIIDTSIPRHGTGCQVRDSDRSWTPNRSGGGGGAADAQYLL